MISEVELVHKNYFFCFLAGIILACNYTCKVSNVIKDFLKLYINVYVYCSLLLWFIYI